MLVSATKLHFGYAGEPLLDEVTFQLNEGDRVGLIGANGEGKSTFMSIITNKMMPDEGKIEWAKNVRVGYLDQHTVLDKFLYLLASLLSYQYKTS